MRRAKMQGDRSKQIQNKL